MLFRKKGWMVQEKKCDMSVLEGSTEKKREERSADVLCIISLAVFSTFGVHFSSTSRCIREFVVQ